jgi:hypothetical protein
VTQFDAGPAWGKRFRVFSWQETRLVSKSLTLNDMVYTIAGMTRGCRLGVFSGNGVHDIDVE